MAPLTEDDLRAVTVNDLRVDRTPHPDILSVVVEVANGSDRWLTSPHDGCAFNLALRWVTHGTELPPDVTRIPVPRPLAPGSTSSIRVLMPAADAASGGTLRATAVGEGVAWREHLGGSGAFRDAEVGPVGIGRPAESTPE
jgi:hypothetical protein